MWLSHFIISRLSLCLFVFVCLSVSVCLSLSLSVCVFITTYKNLRSRLIWKFLDGARKTRVTFGSDPCRMNTDRWITRWRCWKLNGRTKWKNYGSNSTYNPSMIRNHRIAVFRVALTLSEVFAVSSALLYVSNSLLSTYISLLYYNVVGEACRLCGLFGLPLLHVFNQTFMLSVILHLQTYWSAMANDTRL